MHLKDPVVICTLTNPIQAELIANMLKSEGISCFLGGINQASAVGLPGNIIQVNVAAENADRASKIIEEVEEGATA